MDQPRVGPLSEVQVTIGNDDARVQGVAAGATLTLAQFREFR